MDDAFWEFSEDVARCVVSLIEEAREYTVTDDSEQIRSYRRRFDV